LWPSAGVNQMFQFISAVSVDDGSMYQYYIAAVGRSACPLKFLSFPIPCTTQSPDLVDLWNATGPEQTFRLFPIASNQPSELSANTNGPCADPFIWFDPVVGMYDKKFCVAHLPCNSSCHQLLHRVHSSRHIVVRILRNSVFFVSFLI
jgi:hypothetical protein